MTITSPKHTAGTGTDSILQIMDRAWRGGEGVQQLLKRQRALVARVKLGEGQSVIAKLWCSAGIRALIRRKTGTSNRQNSWNALNVLHRAGAPVPRPIGHCELVNAPYTEGLLIEDLGECVLGLMHVKTLIREGREQEHERFVDWLLEVTQLMLKHGVIDPDHGLHNVLVNSDGRALRIDFEMARLTSAIGKRTPYGQMLGRLLTSYIFAAQPDLERIHWFAARIEKSLKPDQAALHAAARFVQEQMDKQRATMNVDTRVKLHW